MTQQRVARYCKVPQDDSFYNLLATDYFKMHAISPCFRYIITKKHLTAKKNECFALRISSVSVAKSVDLVIFAEQILNGKLHFWCSVS